jgi:polar amino acid transport system permease protein
MKNNQPTTDLPVLLPAAERMAKHAAYERKTGTFSLRFKARHGIYLAMLTLMTTVVAQAQAAPELDNIFTVLWRWKTFLLEGFGFNILISFMAMAIGTVAGTLLGLMQVSLIPTVRHSSWIITQFFRNAPWLTLLFFCMFMLPFEFNVGSVRIPFPDWIKAVIGLSLPVMANISEVVRGAIKSIPHGQWEASEALAFSRHQQLWQIILPQCIKRMIPPWMNWYAILTMATVLASIVGVDEIMARAGQVSAAEDGRTDLLLPLYSFILLLFFIYCYPIARWTIRLERKFAVKF